MLRIPLIVRKKVISMDKPQKDHNIKNEKYDVTTKQEKDKKHQVQTLFDVIHESQKKYRELKNIAIDPKFIIEEEEKRQPLSFQE
jgi:alkyl hydroperoxide reductase subunit AhpC